MRHAVDDVSLRAKERRRWMRRMRSKLRKVDRSLGDPDDPPRDGERAGRLLDLGRAGPGLVTLAIGMGVPATRATTAEELADQLRRALAEPGPHLIRAVLRTD
jgi:thiamine pyrophosphate-dependent acetolactate synthase large subunit-like protein